MKVCQNCGSNIDLEDLFCENCGYQLKPKKDMTKKPSIDKFAPQPNKKVRFVRAKK